MNIVYFDCFSGVSGDMTLGAFVDAGLDVNLLKEQLALLHLHGCEISAEKVKRGGIAGTKVHVDVSSEHSHTMERHGHRHRHHHLGLSGIREIIEKSGLRQDVKDDSIKVFHRLAEVEAKVHNSSIEEVHFHEVGAKDAIIDIVGSVIAIKHFNIERLYFSPLPTGHGFTKCEHGTFPVPAPATAELLKAQYLKSVDIEKELTTPTGAAIVTTLGKGLRAVPEMEINRIGYGAGSNDNPGIPNLLRIFIGEAAPPAAATDELWVIETNIDNMSGEVAGYVMDKLFEAGAVDVTFTPVQMKKGRPGITISALAPEFKVSAVEQVLFHQTTTFGIRRHKVVRTVLTREFKELDSRLGKVRVKIGRFDGAIKSCSPEYEDCKRIAEEKGIPLKEVFSIISEEMGRVIN